MIGRKQDEFQNEKTAVRVSAEHKTTDPGATLSRNPCQSVP